MNKRIPLGIEDFKELRENYYFIDKTRFIQEIIDDHSKVTLITRPRRFGKTLTMSMLDYFFSIDKKEVSTNLFTGLSIDQAGVSYMQEQGKYPVIFLSLKNIQDSNWSGMYQTFQLVLQQVFLQFEYIVKSDILRDVEKSFVERIIHRDASVEEYQVSLQYLGQYLYRYHGKRSIILIDEYDAPLQNAYSQGFYDQAILFFKGWFNATLKGNEALHFAVLTGVLRIAKESIFSGLNNLMVCSVLTQSYSNSFGFTAEEIRRMLFDLGISPHKFQEIQQWYDGYQFGNDEIYNPWSVIYYLRNQCIPMPYWVNTSGNGILQELLVKADDLRVRELQGLLYGKHVTTTINDSVIYAKIWQDDSALYTMLLTTGYLTVASASTTTYNRYALRIPNEEIRQVYSTEILNTLVANMSRNSYDALFDSLFSGDGEDFEYRLQRILTRFVSAYDTASKESFYHGFMLGMTALFLDKDYVVESNRESGYGRFDVAIFPRDTNKTGVILEFKASSSVDCLEQEAAEAVRQIQARDYVAEFEKRQIAHLWTYGIAFCGKQVKLECCQIM